MMMEQMYVVIDQTGNRHGGSERSSIPHSTASHPLASRLPVLHLPGTARLWRWLYQQVAKRRYKIGW